MSDYKLDDAIIEEIIVRVLSYLSKINDKMLKKSQNKCCSCNNNNSLGLSESEILAIKKLNG